MKVTQSKVLVIRELQLIEDRLKRVNVTSNNWDDLNAEGLAGFLMIDALANINDRLTILTEKFQ
tara:strand:+ start:4474 stop:4665 length:192 start_codon:yes stop_codon:yes gene_type:complete